MSTFRIVVLASGGGTNLQAILDQLHGGEEGIEVVGVGSDKPEATALERARKAGVETGVFPAAEYEDRRARDAALGDWIEERRGGPGRAGRVHAAALARVRGAIPQPGDQRPSRAAARRSRGSTRSSRRSTTAPRSPA